MRVIVVGAGWAGISAAYEARKCGAEVILLEKTDMILGTGLIGGIMRNNGRFTVFEELKAMGITELIDIIDETSTHKNIDFPGHKHANLYDVTKIENKIRKLLEKLGVDIVLKSRISKVILDDKKIVSVVSDNGNAYEGDVFIDTTGTAGPIGNCIKYGNGCAMCILRCPSYKGRISLTGLCGIKEIQGKKKDGSVGAMSGSCKLLKDSLSSEIVEKLNSKGVAIIPLSEEFVEDHLDIKACQQYALKEYKENLILLDTGHAKLMTPYYNLDRLRKIEGFKNARYVDPYTGGSANSMRFFAIAPHDNSLKVEGLENLLCAGEKVGLVGHTEAIMTGVLAGYNAIKMFSKEDLLELPCETCIGEAIDFTIKQLNSKSGLRKKYTVSGSILFDRLKSKNLYITNVEEITIKIRNLKAENIFY